MRPKIIFLAIILAAILVSLAFWLKKKSALNSLGSSATVPQTQVQAVSNLPTRPPEQVKPVQPVLTDQEKQAAEKAKKTADKQAVEKAIEEINKAIVDAGPTAIPTMIEKLSDSHKEVWSAAVEGLIALDDRTAIPRMMEMIEQVTDIEEKAAIKKAADVLALPSITELNEQEAARIREKIKTK
jgi:hypothetical protein